ncbi:MAG: hypothetical protein A3B89_00075 [Candidatus Buchananbacteria bacterium RIFCSPHIGHO2_02_FULL_40_13]|uniref:VIT family protein n=1 Tax=Candidatus Buchananbacteria bacterium RIFCSPLOWO2_01_FULL_39_33 TaxID=1797543 RepID=A0A1G1YNC0_9BACT|nr:MAG: hypothetical protein A2820_01775 [Candidatus Buchananbacteria bacterium RIFCSPHIGHO2_01_FULL_40_35]OGY51186.1 MAG: hypothetical protein A3B89_00075 [Candidatus Buchananbacteria bacterium RIFCSPHIGHO2_02_FULL_40_13]OGY53296.1 MAG: hypothetical protein A3A02_03270 [Candidatus Buchananbacteria bacterium RIFCSPLOWO2_01_FULL_39_33]
MGNPLKSGFNFGLTSAVITTTGLMIGLTAGTGSKLAVLGGILTIAIADAFSDALGIHISEESKNGDKQKEVWQATLATFISKFIFAITFIWPVLFFNLKIAVLINLIWGALLITILSLMIAKGQNRRVGRIIGEHLLIATLVIILSYYAGLFINRVFS